MRLLSLIYLLCVIMAVGKASVLKTYCYNTPYVNCTDKHILDCEDDQVITTDISQFRVGFLKNRNFAECRTVTGECKNKTTCCIFISNSVTVLEANLKADDATPLIDFIKTDCESKSSCIVSLYYNNTAGPDLYDFVTYNYGCIPPAKDITVDFMVNGTTEFKGNSFPTIYYLDYTGTKQDNEIILNRQCVVSTTKGDITLTIKKLNLQADDCCRFLISRFNVTEYCSENGSFIPPIGTSGKNKATIKLENVVYKDGDSFSILIKAAGNVTINCTTFVNVFQVPSNCQNPTLQSTITPRRSTTITSTTTGIETTTSDSRQEIERTEENGLKYSESDLAVIIGGIVGGLVFLNIIVIIFVVLVRRKLQEKQTALESPDYSSLDQSRRSPEYNYVGMNTASPPTGR